MMEFENEDEYAVEYPDIPLELSEGSFLELFVKEKMAFMLYRCVVDALGNFLIIAREDDYFIDLTQASDIRKNFMQYDDSLKLETRDAKPTFTLVYGPSLVDVKYQHVRCASAELCELWFSSLESQIKRSSKANPSIIYLLQKEYNKQLAIAKSKGKLNTSDIYPVFNYETSRDQFSKYLLYLDLLKDKASQEIRLSQFSFKRFLNIYLTICPRPEIDELFKRQTSSKLLIMFQKEFKIFLTDYQLENASIREVKQLISQYEKDKEIINKECLGLKGFIVYLLSDSGKAANDTYSSRPHNLTRPLAHYYINSSHNTYLIGLTFPLYIRAF